MTTATATPEAPTTLKFRRRCTRTRPSFITDKRYEEMLEQLAPGQYAVTDLAERYDIPYSSFAWMLDKKPHPRFQSEKCGSGQVRTVTVLNP